MRKIILGILGCVLCLCLCACGGSSSFDVKLKDGTTKNMTVEQMDDWKNEYSVRSASEFENMIAQATVSGTGEVVSVEVGEPFSKSGYTLKGNRFPCKVTLDNGVILDITLVYVDDGYAKDNPYQNFPGDIPTVDIYEGDVLKFEGTIYSDCIYEDKMYVRMKTTAIGQFEEKVGLEYMTGVELSN